VLLRPLILFIDYTIFTEIRVAISETARGWQIADGEDGQLNADADLVYLPPGAGRFAFARAKKTQRCAHNPSQPAARPRTRCGLWT
jgi:hypothetical protein